MGNQQTSNMCSVLFLSAALVLFATVNAEFNSDDWEEAVELGSTISTCSNLGGRSPSFGGQCDVTDLCNLMMQMDLLGVKKSSAPSDQKEYYSAYKVKVLNDNKPKGTVFSFGTMGDMARKGQTQSACAHQITTARGSAKNKILNWITTG